MSISCLHVTFQTFKKHKDDIMCADNGRDCVAPCPESPKYIWHIKNKKKVPHKTLPVHSAIEKD